MKQSMDRTNELSDLTAEPVTAEPVTAPVALPERARAPASDVSDAAPLSMAQAEMLDAHGFEKGVLETGASAGASALAVLGPGLPSWVVKVADPGPHSAPDCGPKSSLESRPFVRPLGAPPRPLVPHRYRAPVRRDLAASEAEIGSVAIAKAGPPAAPLRPSIAATLPPVEPPVERAPLTEAGAVAAAVLDGAVGIMPAVSNAPPIVALSPVTVFAHDLNGVLPHDLDGALPHDRVAALPPLSSRPPWFEPRAPQPSVAAFDAAEARSRLPLAVKILKIAALVAGAWAAAVVLLIVAYRFVDPPLSALMVQQRLSGQDIVQDWVALDEVSPQIIRAVLLSEDGRFCQHSGVDFQEMQNAIERAGDGPARGASTISMQVTKNLFLWPSKSYVRKAIEIPLTYLIEALWNKRRILEVYLNIAEWGPGIFGVEAASEFHFGKPARQLSEREAARLAVALPNPFTRDAGDPGPRTQRLAGDIQARMRAAPASQTACVTRAD